MTTIARTPDDTAHPLPGPPPLRVVGEAAATLAVAMGVGRFVYTAILPLMTAGAGLTPSQGATLATANYAGYLIGAVAGIAVPRLLQSRAVLRAGLVAIVASLALMPATRSLVLWGGLRLVAGVASALLFMTAVAGLHAHLRGRGAHLVGWAFGGVGGGIAASGLLVLIVRATTTWVGAWIAAALLAAVLAAPAWSLAPEPRAAPGGRRAPDRRLATRRPFAALLASYTLEGVGYIIAGTFLVAAVDRAAAGWAGNAAWVLVGLAALPSTALWGWLSGRVGRPTLLLTALVVQAVGISLPAVFGGVAPALVSAVLFGGTFLGVTTLALATGASLHVPRAVAIMTTAYSVGQILGPIVVTPLLRSGYRPALLVGACIVLAAALAALVLRVGLPRSLDAAEPS